MRDSRGRNSKASNVEGSHYVCKSPRPIYPLSAIMKRKATDFIRNERARARAHVIRLEITSFGETQQGSFRANEGRQMRNDNNTKSNVGCLHVSRESKGNKGVLFYSSARGSHRRCREFPQHALHACQFPARHRADREISRRGRQVPCRLSIHRS